MLLELRNRFSALRRTSGDVLRLGLDRVFVGAFGLFERQLTIDRASVSNSTAEARIHFTGQFAGKRHRFAMTYGAMKAMMEEAPPVDEMPLQFLHRARHIEPLAKVALSKTSGIGDSVVVLTANDLEV